MYPFGRPFDGMIELCLASVYTEKINPSGWYASDKLDGVRCLWTGKEMYTRNGKLLKLPAYFVTELPASPLDGELYVPMHILSELSKGRSYHGLKFDTNSEKIVKAYLCSEDRKTKFSPSAILASIITSGDDLGWLLLTYWAFDAPGISMPFKHRLSSLLAYFASATNAFVRLLAFSPVKDNADVQQRLQATRQEGLVLRSPTAMYERKRCWSLVKVKACLDADFDVADICLQPCGRRPKRATCLLTVNKGRLGVLLRCPTSERLFVLVSGVTKAVQGECLKAKTLGKRITVKFNGYDRKGVPLQPVFVRTQLTL